MELTQDKKLVYTAMSKHLFYMRMQISKFVYDNGGVPLNPFMISGYFLADSVPRDVIREANNVIVKRSDEIWVFGPVSDGVLAEVKLCKSQGKPVRFFEVIKSKEIKEISKDQVQFEDKVKQFKGEI